MWMFIEQDSRGVRGLAAHTREVDFGLFSCRLALRTGPSGVILVTENRKLHSRRIMEAFRRLHWQHLGRGPQDREWFGRRFDRTPCNRLIDPRSG